jgi:serine/threonine-protein kinase RsbW
MSTSFKESGIQEVAKKPTLRKGEAVGCFRSMPEALATIHTVAETMTTLGYVHKEVFGVRLAFEEAIVNAFKHGNRNDPSRSVQIRHRLSAQRVLVEIEDEGEGFDPGQVLDPLAPENLERPCGRGLLLMRSYLTWIRHNRRGNCVTMCMVRGTPRRVGRATASKGRAL